MLDKEMQAALIADGEKLAALTGEDHGPWEGSDFWRVARPVYHMAMPVNADGNGPASPDETVGHDHVVWDQLCRTVCRCDIADDAILIAAALNSYILPTTN